MILLFVDWNFITVLSPIISEKLSSILNWFETCWKNVFIYLAMEFYIHVFKVMVLIQKNTLTKKNYMVHICQNYMWNIGEYNCKIYVTYLYFKCKWGRRHIVMICVTGIWYMLHICLSHICYIYVHICHIYVWYIYCNICEIYVQATSYYHWPVIQVWIF